MGLVGGLEAPPGRIMGHAGAWAAPGEPDAQFKYNALEKAGVVMVNHPEKFGNGMKALLGSNLNPPGVGVSFGLYPLSIYVLTKTVIFWCPTEARFSQYEACHSRSVKEGNAFTETNSLCQAISSV